MRGNEEKRSRKTVLVIKDPEAIRLSTSFMKSEILCLLSERPMTETQLSKEPGLTKASVGHHLRPLREAGLTEELVSPKIPV
ncbi:MAG: transcriptional regulator [Candidatus Bathyarchaeota archaeon]|nr:transcriptional regulator [Candidatus Bathyarchaeota archaeon]MDH5687771.1 transcriptional regulator [Candidatus Bathyarchaeota archaeon]